MHDGPPQQQQTSPDPQGTHARIHQTMMLVDSATPMFTSEFTIIAPPMVGGLESALGGSNGLIHEWNPEGGLPGPQQLSAAHSHDSYFQSQQQQHPTELHFNLRL